MTWGCTRGSPGLLEVPRAPSWRGPPAHQWNWPHTPSPITLHPSCWVMTLQTKSVACDIPVNINVTHY